MSPFWQGFLKGLGSPTPVIWLWALAVPAFAMIRPERPIWWPMIVVSGLCWVVVIGRGVLWYSKWR